MTIASRQTRRLLARFHFCPPVNTLKIVHTSCFLLSVHRHRPQVSGSIKRWPRTNILWAVRRYSKSLFMRASERRKRNEIGGKQKAEYLWNNVEYEGRRVYSVMHAWVHSANRATRDFYLSAVYRYYTPAIVRHRVGGYMTIIRWVGPAQTTFCYSTTEVSLPSGSQSRLGSRNSGTSSQVRVATASFHSDQVNQFYWWIGF